MANSNSVVELREVHGKITVGSDTVEVVRVGSQIHLITIGDMCGAEGKTTPYRVVLTLDPKLGEQLMSMLAEAVIRATDHQLVASLPTA